MIRTMTMVLLLCSVGALSSARAQISKTPAPASSAQQSTAQSAAPLAAAEQKKLEFQVSIRDAGFMGWTAGGTMSGMLERGFAIDGIQARFVAGATGGVWYAVCTDDGVWQPWVKNGETAGAVSQKNINAIALRLYDMPRTSIAYRVHTTGGEWLEWTRNGEAAGIKGKTIDAVEIRLEQGRESVSTLSASVPPPTLTTETPTQGSVATSGKSLPGALAKTSTSDAQSTSSQSSSAQSSSAPKKIETFTVKDTPPPAATPTSVQKSTDTPTATQQASSPTTTSQQNTSQQNSGQNNGLQQLGQGVGQGVSQGLANQGNNQNTQNWNNQGNNLNTQGSNPNTQGYNQNTQGYNQNTQGNNPNWNNQGYTTSGQPNQPTGQTWSQWTNQPMQRAQGSGTTAKPVFVPISTRRVALLANNGRYISVGNDPRMGAVFAAMATGVGETEVFDIAFVGEHRVALRTLNGRYLGLQSNTGSSARLAPVNDIIGQNEIFDVMSAGQDRVAFRAQNGQYLSVEEFGSYRLFAKDGFVGQWESFGVALPDGKPLLNETPSNALWRTQNDGSRVVVVDQQGRVVESADRVLMLVANSPTNSASGAASSAISANTTPTTTAAASTTPAKPAAATVVNPSTYLTPIEMDIVQELNFVRTKPGEYATLLEGYRKYYKGKTFSAPGQKALTTKEGVKALDEAILTLKMTRPLEALTPSQALSKASRDHVDNAGPRGLLGHVGSDKSNPNDRAARYGKGVVNENCCYGRSAAREVVVRLLIDDGTADRGYRKNILNPAFKLVGTAFGLHKTQQTMCSQVFAAEFTEK
ncbi:MAG: hypothetical protein H9535_16360 [Ignavibacteria bacterium]|nr:hypothetical protein [Ignavibacteria bacterium]